MSLLRNLMGGETHPPLPADSYAAARLDKVTTGLQQLAAETRDRLEVVPAEHSAYVFIGKPPKKFGMAWITGGEVANLGELARQRNFSPITLEKIEDQLAGAYKRSAAEPRYTLKIGGQDVVVTPSEDLEADVHHIIQEILK